MTLARASDALFSEQSAIGSLYQGVFPQMGETFAVGYALLLAGVCYYFQSRKGKKYCGWLAAAYLAYALYCGCPLIGNGFEGVFKSYVATLFLGCSAAFLCRASVDFSSGPQRRGAIWILSGAIAAWLGTASLQIFWGGVRSPVPPAMALWGVCLIATGALYARRTGRNSATGPAALNLILWGLIQYAFAILPAQAAPPALNFYFSGGLAVLTTLGLVGEQGIALADQKYRNILEAIDDAVFIVDLWTYRVLEGNQVAQRLTKYSQEELVGADFTKLCPLLQAEGDKKPEPSRQFNAVFKPNHQFPFVRADGSEMSCEGEAVSVDWCGRLVMQIRLREMANREKLVQASRRADKMSALGQLVAGVAHELNNPLSVVLGRTQLFLKRATGKDRDDLLKVVHEAERAAKIVRELLAFSRPSIPHLEVADINRAVANVLSNQEAEFKTLGIQLEKQLNPDLPLTKADTTQIEQVIANLVGNAVYSLSTVSTQRKLTVRTEENGQIIRITVADTGTGVPVDVISKVFDPFFTTKPPGKGTGLGLTISSSIMTEHRGRLWVENSPGKGATFHVELPIVPCGAEQLVVPSKPKPQEAVHGNGHGRKVLVVDDEEGIRDVLKLAFEAEGHAVDVAADGSVAAQMILTKPYDLILTDYRMPGMDGRELHAQILNLNPKLAERMVFLTGDTVNEETTSFLEKTGNRWIGKPFDINTIAGLLDGCAPLPSGNKEKTDKKEPEPVSPTPKADQDLPAMVAPAAAAEASGQLRLLAVDDEPGIREIVRTVLEGLGHAVDTASDGAEAIKCITAARYDLIVSDLAMPNMDGQALYEAAVRFNPVLASRFVFATGDSVSPKWRKFLGPFDGRWIRKPFSITGLEELVGKTLTRVGPNTATPTRGYSPPSA